MSDLAQTPEAVAFQLLQAVRSVSLEKDVTRSWLLDTYAECLAAASGRRPQARPELSHLQKESTEHATAGTTIGPTEDGL